MKLYSSPEVQGASKSLPTRGAWIEINRAIYSAVIPRSLPTRGAWIEITLGAKKYAYREVAPHKGSVD